MLFSARLWQLVVGNAGGRGGCLPPAGCCSSLRKLPGITCSNAAHAAAIASPRGAQRRPLHQTWKRRAGNPRSVKAQQSRHPNPQARSMYRKSGNSRLLPPRNRQRQGPCRTAVQIVAARITEDLNAPRWNGSLKSRRWHAVASAVRGSLSPAHTTTNNAVNG